jgi:hypothetical protein
MDEKPAFPMIRRLNLMIDGSLMWEKRPRACKSLLISTEGIPMTLLQLPNTKRSRIKFERT